LWHELFGLPRGAHVALDILKGDAPGTGLVGSSFKVTMPH